jgi:DNA-binding NarL/FixJ family response regulator
VTDLSLQEGSGIDLIRDLKTLAPQLPVLVLSMHEETLYAERALRAGASGYIMKHEATEKVLVAIRRVLAGEVYLAPKIASASCRRA